MIRNSQIKAWNEVDKGTESPTFCDVDELKSKPADLDFKSDGAQN